VKLARSQTTRIDASPNANQQQLKNKFIYDLLHGSIENEADILRYSHLFNLDFTISRAVIVIDAGEFILDNRVKANFNPFIPINSATSIETAHILRKITFLINSIISYFHFSNDIICTYIANGVIAVIKTGDNLNTDWLDHRNISQQSLSWANLNELKYIATALLLRLQSDTAVNINIAIGRYYTGVQGIAHSYQEACTVLSLGCRFGDNNQVHCLDKLGVAAFIGVPEEKIKIELATYLLAPLKQDPELITTLKVFFAENCCSSSAAAKLSIHRNTLTYRLDKITTLIGLDPRRFDEAVQIHLSLLTTQPPVTTRRM
jgi:carbohydrate diacid regulator